MPEVGRKAPEGKTHIQSMRFEKSKWSKAEASKWVKEHDGYVDGYDESENEHRWRQYDPDAEKFHYRKFDEGLPDGVYFINGYPGKEQEGSEGMKKQGIFMREIEADAKEVTIDIIGSIGWEVWYLAMRDMLRTIPETIERVIFDIYSPGGDVWEGNAIIQEIGKLKQETVARVQVAASMATLIAVACKTREIASNGRWLVHNPWAALQGDADAFEKRAQELRDCEKEAAKFYSERTGRPQKEMIDLMDAERWLTPKEALEMGFVQKINNPFKTSDYAAVHAEIVAAGKWPEALDIEAEIKPDEESMNANANTDGAETAGGATIAETGESANATPAMSDTERSAYERGHEEGETSSKAEYAAQLGSVAERVNELKAENDKLDALQRTLQGERDSARSQCEKLGVALKEATTKLDRLLTGGMSFAPALDKWDDALKACGGKYEEARRKYPELYRESRDEARANRIR